MTTEVPTTDVPIPAGTRLASLDAYRGAVMLAMISGGFGLAELSEHDPESKLWDLVAYQLDHVSWAGCAAWDLIQPSFMFIVGVAMPFSFASRISRGDTRLQLWFHAIWRALILIGLGIFLRSNGKPETHFTFEDVSTQIGLGYALIFILLGRSTWIALITACVILIGYWLLFALWPLPGSEFNAASQKIPDDWEQFQGFAAHWNKYVNPAGYFDQWFLNLFPRSTPFIVNGGGYQTLNFVPSMATMIFGIVAGQWLLSPRTVWTKCAGLLLVGLLFLAIGASLDHTLWSEQSTWTVAPVVKRIWTSSWAVFSTGWTLFTLALFLALIDGVGFKSWCWPLTIVGMNSITMYVLSWLFKPWVRGTLETHFKVSELDGPLRSVLEASLPVLAIWLIAWWMYRHRIFIRI